MVSMHYPEVVLDVIKLLSVSIGREIVNDQIFQLRLNLLVFFVERRQRRDRRSGCRRRSLR